MKILIVDDNEFSREVIRRSLAGWGECSEAGDGEAAVSLFRRALEEGRPFDLVCMDIMMPRLNGQEALKQMRGIESSLAGDREPTQVMMVTALDDEDNIGESFLGGDAVGYVVKPITPEKLAHEMAAMGFIRE